MKMPPWRRLLTFVMFWGRMTQKGPSLQGPNCIDIYCSHWPLLSISEGWHHPFLILGAVETLGPWEERDPTSSLQVWPLQIFKTLDWSNVCLAGSVSPSCRFVLFWPGFNALTQLVEVVRRPGTRHNSEEFTLWITLTDRRCAKEFKEPFRGILWVDSQGSGAVSLPVALQDPAIKGWATGQTFRHACTACTVFDTSTLKYWKKKEKQAPGQSAENSGRQKSQEAAAFLPSPSQLRPAELLPGNVDHGQITRKNNQITGCSMLNLVKTFTAHVETWAGKDRSEIRLFLFLVSIKIPYRSHKWVNEASTNAGTNVSDWQDESSGRPLLVRHVGQRQVSFGHADGQRPVALDMCKQRKEKRIAVIGGDTNRSRDGWVGHSRVLTCWL